LTTKPDITIVCSRLDLPGGIERAVVELANNFSLHGHSTTLLVIDTATGSSFYPVNERVKVVRLVLDFGITQKGNPLTRKLQFYNHIRKLRAWIKEQRPSIIISSEYHLTAATVLAGRKSVAKIYSWEHHHYKWLKKNRFWSWLSNRTYRRLDGVICLNATEKEYYQQFTDCIVIPNAVKEQPHKEKQLQKRILTIGSLVPRKGIDRLLEVAVDILKRFPGWKWNVVGSGPMEDEFGQTAALNKLEDRLVLFQPVSHDLENVYRSADIYVMTSRFEAFPMVLLEAMSFQVPCISFDCPTGPSDIIVHGKNGLLVEDGNTEKMNEAVASLINNEIIRNNLGSYAWHSSLQFSPERIYGEWEKLLIKV
jgi:glycosyltransferase involved in cell wall biosynthesis